jgi:hypothetical protein
MLEKLTAVMKVPVWTFHMKTLLQQQQSHVNNMSIAFLEFLMGSLLCRLSVIMFRNI